MNELPSAVFRKVYPRLTEATLVTANGHVIGEWVPASIVRAMAELPTLQISGDDAGGWTTKTAQAQRDELLHKINRR